MDKQNVTLSLPKKLLKKAKIVAIRQEKSLSGFLADLLASAVHQDEAYEIAFRRNMARQKSAYDLGTGGKIQWDREALHRH